RFRGPAPADACGGAPCRRYLVRAHAGAPRAHAWRVGINTEALETWQRPEEDSEPSDHDGPDSGSVRRNENETRRTTFRRDSPRWLIERRWPTWVIQMGETFEQARPARARDRKRWEIVAREEIHFQNFVVGVWSAPRNFAEEDHLEGVMS